MAAAHAATVIFLDRRKTPAGLIITYVRER